MRKRIVDDGVCRSHTKRGGVVQTRCLKLKGQRQFVGGKLPGRVGGLQLKAVAERAYNAGAHLSDQCRALPGEKYWRKNSPENTGDKNFQKEPKVKNCQAELPLAPPLLTFWKTKIFVRAMDEGAGGTAAGTETGRV